MTHYTHKKISNGVGKKLKSIFLSLVTITISVVVIFTIVKAGNLDSPGSPADTMKTLDDIYYELDKDASATSSWGLDSSAAPTSTMYTLQQIYDKTPKFHSDPGNASTSDVFTSKTFYKDTATKLTGTLQKACYSTGSVSSTYAADETDRYCIDNTDAGTLPSAVNQVYTGKGYWTGSTWATGTAACTETATPSASIIKSGETYCGTTGTYVTTYTWTRVATTTQWEGVNENLDWAKEIGGTSWWNNITYSYCTSTACTNNGTTSPAASYTGPPGGWNGSNDSTNFNNSALHNYEVITANGTNLSDCTADAGDLVFPDGSVWDKSASNAYATTVANCDVNDSNAATIWSNAGGSGSQYAYARNAPSALSIADAWDEKKNLTTGANNTHSYSQDGINNDYYDRPSQSWYVDTGDGVGTSRLPMIEEYERARQGTSSTTVSLLWGTTNWAQYNWSAEQYPAAASYARNFAPSDGYANVDYVNAQTYRLWVVVAQ